MSAVDEDVEAVLETLRSGWLTMGPRIQAFEEAFAGWVDAPHAVAVSSGTAALQLACLAVGVQPGDEVVVPAYGSAAAAAAPGLCGAETVFSDVLPSGMVDVVDVGSRITDRTRAVIAVHTWGHPADVVLLRELCDRHGIALIEDCREAIGATVDHRGRQAGTVGHAGCFSFADGRALSVGQGGMVVSADEDVAARVRLLRAHGMTSGTWDRHRGHSATYDLVAIGFNYRLDEPRAALGIARLGRLHHDLSARRAAARRMRDRGDLTPIFGHEDDARTSFSGFPAFGEGERRPALADLPHATQVAERAVLLPLES